MDEDIHDDGGSLYEVWDESKKKMVWVKQVGDGPILPASKAPPRGDVAEPMKRAMSMIRALVEENMGLRSDVSSTRHEPLDENGKLQRYCQLPFYYRYFTPNQVDAVEAKFWPSERKGASGRKKRAKRESKSDLVPAGGIVRFRAGDVVYSLQLLSADRVYQWCLNWLTDRTGVDPDKYPQATATWENLKAKFNEDVIVPRGSDGGPTRKLDLN